ncbi:MAG: signal peptidase I [Candidatus Krumholzibacteriia bacterium]
MLRPRSSLRRLRGPTLRFTAPIVLALLVRAALVQAYHIPSGSMEPTLYPGDVIVAEKWSFGTLVPGKLPGMSRSLPSLRTPGMRSVRPGDLVILEHPTNPDVDLVKRCVAVEGQEVVIRDKNLFVDGERIPMPPGARHLDPRILRGRRDQFGPVLVPEGHIFVLGDNRDNSLDSRFFGSVPVAKLRAHPVAIVLSWDTHAAWRSKLRWRRAGALR